MNSLNSNSLGSATILQSTRSLTDGLYNNVNYDIQDQKERQAIDMDTYNQQILKEQIDKANKTRNMINKNIEQINIERQNIKKKQSERELKERELQDNAAWSSLKDHWYWGSYFNDVNKTSFSSLDNYLEKSKPDSYLPVKLGDKYSVVGADYIEYEFPKADVTDQVFVYRAPFRDYVYDVKYNKLIPADAKYEQPTPEPTKSEEELLEQAFNLKYNSQKLPSSTNNPSSLKEGFQNEKEKDMDKNTIDPKLYEIYQKTLTPDEYKNADISDTNILDIIYSYNYIFIVIIAIILFLLFQSS